MTGDRLRGQRWLIAAVGGLLGLFLAVPLVALVVVAVLASAVAAFFYLRVIVLMFFQPSPESAPTVALPGALTTAVVTLAVAATALLGVVPQPVLDLASSAGVFVG